MKRSVTTCMKLMTVAVVFAACSSSMNVTSDYDKKADFANYKTFMIYDFRTPQTLSQLNQDRIVNAVKNEMMRKGFLESVTPDMLVQIAAIFKNEQTVTAVTDYYSYGGYYRPYLWDGGLGMEDYTTYSIQNYINGSLIIEIADTKAKNLLWEGIGNKDIDEKVRGPDVAIPATVGKIMESFPPGTVNITTSKRVTNH